MVSNACIGGAVGWTGVGATKVGIGGEWVGIGCGHACGGCCCGVG